MNLMENEQGFSRVNLYEQIADFVERKILLGDDPDFSEGKKLPPEQEAYRLYLMQILRIGDKMPALRRIAYASPGQQALLPLLRIFRTDDRTVSFLRIALYRDLRNRNPKSGRRNKPIVSRGKNP